MENISHTLFGLSIAELINSRLQNAKLRVPIITASVLANNFPDIDLAYTTFLQGKLAYLLHHRGHTHTLVGIIPQIVLLLLAFHFFNKWKNIQWSLKEWLQLCLVASIGFCTHITLDFLNNYGVHPFWPWNNSWYYGDSIFILEPFFWLTMSVSLYFSANKIAMKFSLIFCFVAAIALCLFINIVPIAMKAFYLCVALISVFICWKFRQSIWIKLFGITASILFIIFQLFHSQSVEKKLNSLQIQNTELLEYVLTPEPANLACWSIMRIETQQDIFRIRLAKYSSFDLFGLKEHCFKSYNLDITAKLDPQDSKQQGNIRWLAIFQAPLSELKLLQQKNCHFRGFLQYARAPFWQKISPTNYLVGDLRYDRNKQLDFAEFLVKDKLHDCPSWLSHWNPPLKIK